MLSDTFPLMPKFLRNCRGEGEARYFLFPPKVENLRWFLRRAGFPSRVEICSILVAAANLGAFPLMAMLARILASDASPFDSLSEQEILALAISSEEDDARIYRAYAEGLRDQFPQSARVFEEMAEEEDRHRVRLIELHRQRFGEHIPLIRREHVRGYYERKPDWLVRPLGIEKVRGQAEAMEEQAARFTGKQRKNN